MKIKKTTPRRIEAVLTYLINGGTVIMGGMKYVWLNEHVVRSTPTHDHVIDGLAIEMKSFDSEGDVGSPYYIGQSDIALLTFMDQVASIEKEVMADIRKANAMELRRKVR